MIMSRDELGGEIFVIFIMTLVRGRIGEPKYKYTVNTITISALTTRAPDSPASCVSAVNMIRGTRLEAGW